MPPAPSSGRRSVLTPAILDRALKAANALQSTRVHALVKDADPRLTEGAGPDQHRPGIWRAAAAARRGASPLSFRNSGAHCVAGRTDSERSASVEVRRGSAAGARVRTDRVWMRVLHSRQLARVPRLRRRAQARRRQDRRRHRWSRRLRLAPLLRRATSVGSRYSGGWSPVQTLTVARRRKRNVAGLAAPRSRPMNRCRRMHRCRPPD